MTRVTTRTTPLPDHDPAEVWAWLERPGTAARLLPPWRDVRVLRAPARLAPGERFELAVRAGGLPLRWTSTVEQIDPPRAFTDVTEGFPLRSWQHEHRVDPLPGGGTRLHDAIAWSLLPWVPRSTAATDRELRRLLAFRHRRTAEDLALHARHADAPRLVVGITGASGLVGSAMADLLRSGGHTVVPFVRRPARPGEIHWDPDRGVLDPAALAGLDAVVHLAGESIASGRWTAARKERIRQSRLRGTRLVAEAVARSGGPRVLVSASATGFWGNAPEPVDESHGPGTGFLAELAVAWEAAADPARAAGVRVVHPRFGVVISARGGMLRTLVGPASLGVAGPLGNGRQPQPWVALDDVVAVLYEALFDPRYVGPIAVVAPQPVSQAEGARLLGRALHRPACLPVPAPAVRLAFGQMGEDLLLHGQHVVPARLRDLGYRWLRPDLGAAIRWELGRFDPDEEA